MPLAPLWGPPDCELRGWLIRPDNDACPCPPPRTGDGSHARRWEMGVESLGGEEVEIKETGAAENQDS